MKKLLYIDNSIKERYKPYEHFKDYFTIPYDVVYASKGQVPSSVEGYTHILISGSSACVHDDEEWIRQVEMLIKQAYDKNINVLGVCFGHQLLAKTLFGPDKVITRKTPEIGWREVRILKDDKIFGRKGSILYGFVYHYQEVQNVLEGIIGYTDNSKEYIFKVKDKNIWGVQPHFEIDIDQGKELIDRSLTSKKINELGVFDYEIKDSKYIVQMMSKFQAL